MFKIGSKDIQIYGVNIVSDRNLNANFKLIPSALK